MRSAFGLIRRSSYKQQDNNSVEIQKQHIQEFAKRNNLDVPDELIFIEDVTSAYSKRATQRKQLMKLGEKMIELNIPIVIFYDISRIDRTGYSFTIDFYRPMLEKMPNLEVYTTDSNTPLDPRDFGIKINFLLFHHESEVKSERAVGSLTTDLESEKTIRPGSKTPFGYKQLEKVKQLQPSEDAEIVAFIFFLASWGKSLQKIASLLNIAEIPSPKGGVWRTSTIENILKNSVYTGTLNWNVPKRKDGGKKHFVFEDSHPAITDAFHLHLVRINNNLQRAYGRIDTPFLFLNKVKCKHCNELLSTQNGSTRRKGKKYIYQYYVCKTCEYKVNAHELHELFSPLISKYIKDLITNDQTKVKTLESIERMINKTLENIQFESNSLIELEKKLRIAKELKDRELELKILEFIQHYQDSKKELEVCKDNLNTTYQLVDSGQFFPRFDDILDHQLGLEEKRLLTLYFVEELIVSTDQEPHILFKSNIFSEMLSQ
jgi:site-specific DNA recombinase